MVFGKKSGLKKEIDFLDGEVNTLYHEKNNLSYLKESIKEIREDFVKNSKNPILIEKFDKLKDKIDSIKEVLQNYEEYKNLIKFQLNTTNQIGNIEKGFNDHEKFEIALEFFVYDLLDQKKTLYKKFEKERDRIISYSDTIMNLHLDRRISTIWKDIIEEKYKLLDFKIKRLDRGIKNLEQNDLSEKKYICDQIWQNLREIKNKMKKIKKEENSLKCLQRFADNYLSEGYLYKICNEITNSSNIKKLSIEKINAYHVSKNIETELNRCAPSKFNYGKRMKRAISELIYERL